VLQSELSRNRFRWRLTLNDCRLTTYLVEGAMNRRRVSGIAIMVGLCVLASNEASTRSNAAKPSYCSPVSGTTVRSEKPFDVELGIRSESVHSGGNLVLRIENRGSEDIAFGLAYRMERLARGRWEQLPSTPVFGILEKVPAAANRCQIIPIPREAQAGRYRVTKWVGKALDPPGRYARFFRLFSVT
jgi:hypothetical protein